MALTRKFLSALDIESDKIDEIISAHADTVDGLKEERDAYKANAEKYEADAKKLPDIQKELDEIKNGNNPFESKYNDIKAEYDKLKGEYDDYKKSVDAEASTQKKKDAYKALLKEAGISEKRLDSILKISELDKIELDKDGNIKDKESLTKSAKEEWADFIVTEGQEGATTPKLPAGGNPSGAPKGESRAAKIAAQYHANLYGTTES